MIGVFRESKLRIRVERKYKGDVYMYEVEFDKHGTRECTVRQYCTTISSPAIIEDDNLHIKLSIPMLIKDINGENHKFIDRLKVSPTYRHHIKEQVEL